MYSPPRVGAESITACITTSFARLALARSTARTKAARETGEKSDASITVRIFAMLGPPEPIRVTGRSRTAAGAPA